LENLTKVILVAYPYRFRLEEAKSLVESLQNEIVAYTIILNNATSGKLGQHPRPEPSNTRSVTES
jgi:hypothetical protein